MGLRRKFIAFTGASQILLTLAMFTMGVSISNVSLVATVVDAQDDTMEINNATFGVPLWAGLVILMCGAGNLVEAFTARPSRKRVNDLIPCSVCSFFANLVAFVSSGLIIGLFSWSMFDIIGLYVIPFSTVIVASSLVFILSMCAMFVDCFAVCFGGPTPPITRPYYVDYEGRGPVPGYKP